MTRVTEGHAPDSAFEEARRFFSEKELVDLTLGIVAINGWNRLNIAFRSPAGTYQPVPRTEAQAESRSLGAGASH